MHRCITIYMQNAYTHKKNQTFLLRHLLNTHIVRGEGWRVEKNTSVRKNQLNVFPCLQEATFSISIICQRRGGGLHKPSSTSKVANAEPSPRLQQVHWHKGNVRSGQEAHGHTAVNTWRLISCQSQTCATSSDPIEKLHSVELELLHPILPLCSCQTRQPTKKNTLKEFLNVQALLVERNVARVS